MLSMYEPTSLSKLAKKGADMHEASAKALKAALSVSPRGGDSPNTRASLGDNRRRSSHAFGAEDVIQEMDAGQNESDSSSEEEKKEEPA